MLGEIYLFNRNAKGKIIVTFLNNLIDDDGFYVIEKQTGQLGGKWTQQPSKVIEKGKAKRTLEQQFELELNSIIKKLRDKGYKLLVEDLGLTNEDASNTELLESKLGMVKTTADGYRKPMLAVTAESLKESDLRRAWWMSYKLDGYRTLVHLEVDENGEDLLIFKTRGGGKYQGVAKTLERNPMLIDLIRTYDCEIDGEFYIHGLPLNKHTKICNKEEYDPEIHDTMGFHIFDLADNKMSANDRMTLLNKLGEEYDGEYDRIHFVKHQYVKDGSEAGLLVADAVALGYEGMMGRAVGDKYQWGKRNKSLIKFKPFQDDEFEVIRIVQGNRHIHDMVFELYTKDKANTFKAVPLGDFFVRKEYTENEKDYIGKMATVKFQRYNEENGIPQLPTFISVREPGT